eukprot:1150548-Pelagomonas_calceolata.AAC.2
MAASFSQPDNLLCHPQYRGYSHLHVSTSKGSADDKQSLLQTPHCLPASLLQAWDYFKGLEHKSPFERPEPYLAQRNDPIRNARHAVMLGIGKCKKLSLEKKQISKVPYKPAIDITAPIPCQSNPNLQLKVADSKAWAYIDGSCQVQDGKTVIRAGVYHPMSD